MVDSFHSTRRRLCAQLIGAPAVMSAAAARSQPTGGQVPSDAVADPLVRRFYEARDWRPAWSIQAGVELSTGLEKAEDHGLQAVALSQFIDPAASPGAQDAQLTSVALRYAGILATGAVDPAAVNEIYTLPRADSDLVAGLAGAIDGGRMAAWLDSLPPSHASYKALMAAYAQERRTIGRAQPLVPEGDSLEVGDSDERVPAIRQALELRGFAPPPTQQATLVDDGLAEAVKRLQADEGLAVDGVIGPETTWALNRTPTDRARQLALNLERWRWLERPAPATRIDVNTAAAEMAYHLAGAPPFLSRVVVGRPDWATPSLGASFDHLVVNPPWYVPQSIARRELLPKGSAYLRRNNMYLRNGRVVQRPGPESALGLVKFDMQNPHAIYLHDTPAKSLFASDQRHRSHGCVRVDDAVGFARRLSEERGKGAAFDSALRSGQTQMLDLGESIPVRLLYLTAFVRDGRVVYANDPYGRDDPLAAALGMPTARRPSRTRFSAIPFGP